MVVVAHTFISMYVLYHQVQELLIGPCLDEVSPDALAR